MIRSDLKPPTGDRKTIDRLAKIAEQVVVAVDSRLPYADLISEFYEVTKRSFQSAISWAQQAP